MRHLLTRPILAGLAAAAPFAAVAGFSAVMAARHAASLFPLGAQICGHAPLAHCAWCLATPAAAAMGLAAFVIAVSQAWRPGMIAVEPD